MEYQDLTDEMKKKVQSCETSEEILVTNGYDPFDSFRTSRTLDFLLHQPIK